MKRKIWVIFLTLFFIGCTAVMLPHDANNPCTNQQDEVECEYWKKKYPREYKNYLERMEKHIEKGKIDTCQTEKVL
jgi:hypothetical protein